MAWLGALPQSSFATGQLGTVTEPFLWGRGGRRMTPEDIEFQRRIAAQEGQGDYSPVQHWSQGLGRVLDGLSSGLRNRRADKASDANAAEADAVMRALMGQGEGAPGGGSGDPVAAALMNQNLPSHVRDFAKMQWDRANPKPQQPTEFERMLEASGVQRGTPEWALSMGKAVQNRTDPLISIPLPGGRTAVGPRSLVEAEITGMKGGGPLSTGPGGSAPPSTLPPDFDFDGKGGPVPSASGRFP